MNGAVVVDLINFQQFSMDTTTWQATIGAGTLLSDVTKRLHDHGKRAIAHGTCPQVGIGGNFVFLPHIFSFAEITNANASRLAGHATIGGLGPPSRMWGTALDHVLEVEVVLANSTVTRASAAANSEIFFVNVVASLCRCSLIFFALAKGLKGAGASFGIITEFVFKTHPEPGSVVHYSYNITCGSLSILKTPSLSHIYPQHQQACRLGEHLRHMAVSRQ